MSQKKREFPMLQLLKTIQESEYKLNIEDVTNLIYYYKEIEEIEHSILETNGWKQKLDTYYEIFDGCSLEPVRKYSEVVKSSSR